MPNDTPAVIDRFLAAEENDEFEAFASCFVPEGIVLDEGKTYIGRVAIADWRRRAATDGPAFTAEVTAKSALGPEAFRVVQHLEGDFPGGVADLDFNFALKGDQIAALMVFQREG